MIGPGHGASQTALGCPRQTQLLTVWSRDDDRLVHEATAQSREPNVRPRRHPAGEGEEGTVGSHRDSGAFPVGQQADKVLAPGRANPEGWPVPRTRSGSGVAAARSAEGGVGDSAPPSSAAASRKPGATNLIRPSPSAPGAFLHPRGSRPGSRPRRCQAPGPPSACRLRRGQVLWQLLLDALTLDLEVVLDRAVCDFVSRSAARSRRGHR